ncbi:SMC-Scp complex subunit ScpB [bacterium]|nr:SMC-Scp complex subunit ScpB [bacterium]RQV95270.1 MAG: SMC-Scp complex subunit ScpB [bacterium]
MDGELLKQVVEALIFASDVPLTDKQIKEYLDGVSLSEIRKVVDGLNLEYGKTNRAFQIIRVAGGYQMVTRETYSQWVKKLYQKRSRSKLSQAALETLAVVAFKQPVARSEIVAIRGVNCDAVLKTLLERKLVTIAGRSDGPGRPLIYTTTKEFLRYFGVNDLSDLPKLKEIEEILKENEDAPELADAKDLLKLTEDLENPENAAQ